MSGPDGLWIGTQPATDGTYIAALEIGQDLSIPLTHEGSVRYARAVLDASLRADYDAAIFNQMSNGVDLTQDHIAYTLTEVRGLRPPLDHDATAPLAFTPGVNTAGEAFIAVMHDGRQIGQFDPADAVVHAAYILQGPIAANLDAAYHRWLREGLDLDDARARAMVGDLEKWRTADTTAGPDRDEDTGGQPATVPADPDEDDDGDAPWPLSALTDHLKRQDPDADGRVIREVARRMAQQLPDTNKLDPGLLALDLSHALAALAAVAGELVDEWMSDLQDEDKPHGVDGLADALNACAFVFREIHGRF